MGGSFYVVFRLYIFYFASNNNLEADGIVGFLDFIFFILLKTIYGI